MSIVLTDYQVRVMTELRTPVMALVEASWEVPGGSLRTVPARMVNKSPSGACIRMKTPIVVGSKLRIQWRHEQFSGTARYCRSEGREYLVGIQRGTRKSPVPNRPSPSDVPAQKSAGSSHPPISTVDTRGLPQRQESKAKEIPIATPPGESAPVVGMASSTTAPPRGVGETDDQESVPVSPVQISRLQDFDVLRSAQVGIKQPPQESGKERKSMGRKWLDLAPWRSKQDGLSVSGDGNGNGKSEKENLMLQVTPPREKAVVHSAREVPTFQVELLPPEDIYRTAGIMSPRKGYSINKVVEMLHSEHIRGLSNEMKRAALLMALDGAGIPIDQVQQDAKARQGALDTYEAQQRKQVEAEWVRKAEEIIQIQAELESIKAHYMARISRNMEGVAREKATFASWLALKQQECRSMAEAVELCLKSSVSEPASAPPPEVSMVKVSAKTV